MFKSRIIGLELFIFLFAAYFAVLKVIPADYNDMHDHAAFARQMCTGEIPYTGNFLVYLLVNVFSFFTANVKATELSLCFLLAAAGVYRFMIAQDHIDKVFGFKKNTQWINIFLALSMLFVFAIPIPSYFLGDNFMYIGNYVPNVWHNSTILFLFPFALLLFEVSYKQLQEFDTKRNWWVLGLILLNLFIKPSFFFVFICIYPLMLLVKYGLKKEFWLAVLPLIIGFFVLILQFWVIYKTPQPLHKEASSVIFMPFYRNPEFSDLYLIPITMSFSLLFPILYSALNFRKVIYNQLFWYVLLSYIVSVLIFFFISESGPRASHGNFYWQIIICAWLCFFVSLLALLKDFRTEGKTLKNKLLLNIFLIHVILGIVYFMKILVTGGYY